MSNTVYIGKQVRSFDSSPQFEGYTRVVITVSDDSEIAVGTDTGRTLTLHCPWATEEMANDILESIRGFKYQPYTASDALLDPAAELGDGVTVNDVYGGIYKRETKFGPLCTASISAPAEEEIDHEYPYVSPQERQVTRQFANVYTTFTVHAGLISAEVESRKSDVETLQAALKVQADSITAEVKARQEAVGTLSSQLQLQADEISAKVSKSGGSGSSFGWTLKDDSWTVSAGGSAVFRVDRYGAEITGKITARSGKIGGFDILTDCISYNSMNWGGTNSRGIYIGPNGIQLGKNFQVDSAGNLTAASGVFTGAVKAGSIQYGLQSNGVNYGTLSGYALTSGTVIGGTTGAIKSGSITTYNTAGGINTSLGYANFSNDVFNGIQQFGNIAGSLVSAKDLKLNGCTMKTANISYTDANGSVKNMNVITWSDQNG